MLLPCATPEATGKVWKTPRHLSALWLRKLSVTLLWNSQSSTITTVCPLRPCLHSTAPSSSSHKTGCTVSKLRFSFNHLIWFCFESQGGDEAVSVISCGIFFLIGSVTNVYLTIKRPLSNTLLLNRIQNDLEHWPVSQMSDLVQSL